jgi:serine/threonine protein kinase
VTFAPQAPQRTYQFIQELSQSDFNRVFLAQDDAEKKYWAVKELYPPDPSPEGVAAFHRDFVREASQQMAVVHRGLPRVAEYFVHEGNAYLVKEFIDGRTLKDMVLNYGGQLQMESVLTWADQVAEALQALHEAHPPLIAQGLKPNNVVLPQTGRPRIMDLGTARFMSGDTRTRLLTGLTPWYTSPEQAAGFEPDVRSDVYSLGALTWFLLTGKDPVPVEGVVPSVKSRRTETPVKLAEALDVALRRRSNERFATVQALRDVYHSVATVGRGGRFAVDEVHVQLLHVKRGEKRLCTLHVSQEAADNTIAVEATESWIEPLAPEVKGRNPEVDFYVNTAGLTDAENHRGKLVLSSGQYRKEVPVMVGLHQPILRQILKIIAPAKAP